MKMKPEFREGREARTKFEQAMKTLFNAPKAPKVKRPKKGAISRKSASDKDA